MKENPLYNPEQPVYSPAGVLSFIKTNGGGCTEGDLESLLGVKLLARVALMDFDVSRLIKPTDEFRKHPSEAKMHRVYTLTELGKRIEDSKLGPRRDITFLKLSPEIIDLFNKKLNEPLTPEEAKRLDQGLQEFNKRLLFPTQNPN